MLDQYSSSWKMIKSALNDADNSIWSFRCGDWFFSITLYHIIETMDFYSRENPGTMKWGKRAGYSWEEVKDISKDILPLITRDLLQDYQNEMEEKITKTLQKMSDDAFSRKDGFHWFESIFQKFVYLLRHNQHHLGEVAFAMRTNNAGILKWT